MNRSPGHTTGQTSRSRIAAVVGVIAAICALMTSSAAAAAPTPPQQDPFYRYTGSTPLASIAPGTVLKTRALSYHIVGIPLPVSVVQLLYRTTGSLGQPTVDVTSVIKPALGLGANRVVAYGSFYDSLDPIDDPSYVLAGGTPTGSSEAQEDNYFIAQLLLAGDTVVDADTEGESADFAAGREYGTDTLDSVRAAFNSPATGISAQAKVALVGYSGGAIATDWAAELAPSYAPDVNRRLIGASYGGVFVDPIHNLFYVSGSQGWGGVLPMALIGLGRAFGVDLTPYLSSYGASVVNALQNSGIGNATNSYPGLTWQQLVKPQYANPESIPVLDKLSNELTMGTGGTPTEPQLIVQGTNGAPDGTAPSAQYGTGDGVMVAGDVRSLAREYCAAGVPVRYQEADLSHEQTALAAWWPLTAGWLAARFSGAGAPQNCSSIPPGNSLAPVSAP